MCWFIHALSLKCHSAWQASCRLNPSEHKLFFHPSLIYLHAKYIYDTLTSKVFFLFLIQMISMNVIYKSINIYYRIWKTHSTVCQAHFMLPDEPQNFWTSTFPTFCGLAAQIWIFAVSFIFYQSKLNISWFWTVGQTKKKQFEDVTVGSMKLFHHFINQRIN